MWCSLDVHTCISAEKLKPTDTSHTCIYLRYIYVKCNQSSRDFRNWPLRCSHIAQLASQSLHTFFASLSSYINFEAVCTTGNNMLFIHYLQCKHNMFSDIICARKGLQSKPLVPFYERKHHHFGSPYSYLHTMCWQNEAWMPSIYILAS